MPKTCVDIRLSHIKLECRKLCIFRCFKALTISTCLQYILFCVFVLFVNFHILHPVVWISETIGITISIRTWLSMIPLTIANVVYSICLGKCLFAEVKYYPTRFKWILGTALKKLIFLSMHMLVGFVTSQLYTSYMDNKYRHWTYECYGMRCINVRHIFLRCAGISAGCYHFVKTFARKDVILEFPFVQQDIVRNIRTLLRDTFLTALLIKSFLPLISFTFGYWLLSGVLHQRCARLFNAEIDANFNGLFALAGDFGLIFYAWIFITQILTTMQLFLHTFSMLLVEEINFPIAKKSLLFEAKDDVTLVEALSMTQIPIVQNLAALELCNLSKSKSAEKRKQLFALSTPGNHPHNWQQLSAQCLCIIDTFTDELSKAVTKIASLHIMPMAEHISLARKPTATEMAEQMWSRQYNATYGIRNMIYDESEMNKVPDNNNTSVTRAANIVTNVCQRNYEQSLLHFQRIKKMLFHGLPGVTFIFGETDVAKTLFLLANSQTIIYLAHGLARICAISIVEDEYGVVQPALPQIIRSLLKLKATLDKLNNVNLNGNKFNPDFLSCQSAVKRSLLQICNTFGNYLHDFIEDREELEQLEHLLQ